MDILNNWIYTIVLAMIFVTFVDILMPNTAMKKYTKMVLGLLVMTIILNPILKFIKKDFSLTDYSIKYQNQLDSMYIKEHSTAFSESQSLAVSKLYKKNLEEQIANQVIVDVGNKDVEVDVKVVEDTRSKDYGEIKNIIVTIRDGSIKAVDKVERVLIDDEMEGQNEEVERKSKIYEEVRNKISSLYEVPKDMVKINVQ